MRSAGNGEILQHQPMWPAAPGESLCPGHLSRLDQPSGRASRRVTSRPRPHLPFILPLQHNTSLSGNIHPLDQALQKQTSRVFSPARPQTGSAGGTVRWCGWLTSTSSRQSKRSRVDAPVKLPRQSARQTTECPTVKFRASAAGDLVWTQSAALLQTPALSHPHRPPLERGNSRCRGGVGYPPNFPSHKGTQLRSRRPECLTGVRVQVQRSALRGRVSLTNPSATSGSPERSTAEMTISSTRPGSREEGGDERFNRGIEGFGFQRKTCVVYPGIKKPFCAL